MITYRDYEQQDWKSICQIHDRAPSDELQGPCDPCGFIPIEQDKEVRRFAGENNGYRVTCIRMERD